MWLLRIRNSEQDDFINGFLSPDINELIDVGYELLMHIITLDKLVSISTKITDLNNGFQQLPIL